VRELENIIERAVVLCRDNIITLSDIPNSIRGFKQEEIITSSEVTLADRVEALEKKLIYDALDKANGNQTLAAKMLGLTERNIRYKIQKYEIKTKTF